MAQGWARFNLVGTLASGPTGTVFLCDETATGHRVVVKELTSALAARARATAPALSRVDSPNCVRVYEFFEEGGRPFLYEEYVDGGSLRALTRNARLSPEQGLGVLRQVLSGLGFAHAQGVVHGDIKPENVLLDRSGTSKLTDFTQAMPADPANPGILGSAAYIAPEVAQGAPAGPAADIYSAGVMAFELLTGRLPYSAESPAALLRMHVESPVPDPRDAVPGLPDDVAFLVGRAMTKDPAARHPSASDFYHALEAAAAAAYGADWLQRSSVAALVPAAPVPSPLAAPAPAPTTAAAPAPAARARVRLLRFIIGTAIGIAMLLFGLAFGATHGILPGALGQLGFGLVKPPPAVPEHLTDAQASVVQLLGQLGDVRRTVRLWLTISALVGGVCVVVMNFRGFAKRLATRRRGVAPAGGLLGSLVFGLGAVVGILVMAGAGICNFVLDSTLGWLPSI